MRGFILSVIAIISLTANLSTVKGDSYAPRARVIIDNDFAGDPDGIVALSHHLLSTSVDVVGVIGSFFR